MEDRLEQLSEVFTHLAPRPVWEIGPVTITTTVVNTWIIMAVLFLVVFLLTRRLSLKPRGPQTVLELLFEFFYGMIDQVIGREGRRYLPLVATMFIFILALNLSWFIPEMLPPTTDLSTTAALAFTAIAGVQVVGIRHRGLWGYLKRFLEPVPVMLPMNVLEELVKPFSLAIRLFGNLFGEETVVAILVILVPLLVPVPIMVLGVLMGTVQAFVFALLTLTYLGTAVKGH